MKSVTVFLGRMSRKLCDRKLYFKRLQPPQAKILSPSQTFAFEFKLGQPSKHRFKHDLAFKSRQWSSKTEMRRPTECQVSIVGAGDIKLVWLWEALGCLRP
jgi:hypothetical protein